MKRLFYILFFFVSLYGEETEHYKAKKEVSDDVYLLHIPRGTMKDIQFKEYLELVNPQFFQPVNNKNDLLNTLNIMETYQLRNKQGLISNLNIKHKIFYGRKIKKDVLILYSVCTIKKYRRNGYSKRLIKESIDHYIRYKKLNIHNKYQGSEKNSNLNKYSEVNNDICVSNNYDSNISYVNSTELLIALHISPFDHGMDINYAFYVSLGFEIATPVISSPEIFTHRLEHLNNLGDVRTTARNISKCKDRGKYFAMFCRYENFMKKEIQACDELINEGNNLRMNLIFRN